MLRRKSGCWLIADSNNFSHYFNIPITKIRTDPEMLPDPKEYIFRMVERYSNEKMKKAILPKKHATIGRQYNAELSKFIIKHWNPNTARNHSENLGRAIDSINGFISTVYG